MLHIDRPALTDVEHGVTNVEHVGDFVHHVGAPVNHVGDFVHHVGDFVDHGTLRSRQHLNRRPNRKGPGSWARVYETWAKHPRE